MPAILPEHFIWHRLQMYVRRSFMSVLNWNLHVSLFFFCVWVYCVVPSFICWEIYLEIQFARIFSNENVATMKTETLRKKWRQKKRKKKNRGREKEWEKGKEREKSEKEIERSAERTERKAKGRGREREQNCQTLSKSWILENSKRQNDSRV